MRARVVRGGSWNNNRNNARCAIRNRNNPDNYNNNIGFRVVLSHNIFLCQKCRTVHGRRSRQNIGGLAPGSEIRSSGKYKRDLPPRMNQSPRQVNFKLDLPHLTLYNPSHSEVVRVPRPDREGDERWKSPQGNNAEVV